MLSLPHLVVIFVIALVVFGPQKLPELARTLGKLMAEFRKASGDFRSAFEEEMRDLERQARETERKVKEASHLPAASAPLSAEPTPEPSPEHTISAEPLSSTYDASPSGEWIPTTPSSDASLDLPPRSDLSPASGEPGIDHQQPDQHNQPKHLDSQPDDGNSSSPARSNHVDRQPA